MLWYLPLFETIIPIPLRCTDVKFMDVYHQFFSPTAVSHSVCCNFTSPKQKNLIVCKGTVLQVFDVVESTTEEIVGGEALNLNQDSFIDEVDNVRLTKTHKLSLVKEFSLNGLVTAIEPVRTAEAPTLDYLLICTKTAKLSLVKWEASLNISTVSLHQYEPLLESLTFSDIEDCYSKMVVDPNSLCACFFYQDMFVFLPFCEREEHQPTSGLVPIFKPSFVMNAAKLDPTIEKIVDISFMYSYRDPTLAVLTSPLSQTWAGTIAKPETSRDCLRLLVLSLDLESKTCTSVIDIPQLPYDCERIISLASPLNGCLVVGYNELIHVTTMGSVRGIAVNKFTQKTTSFKLSDQTSLGISLEGAQFSVLDESKVLCVTKDGRLWAVQFDRIGGRGVALKSIEEIPLSQTSWQSPMGGISCLSKVSDSLLFMGNEAHHHQLVGYGYGEVTATPSSEPRDENKEYDSLYEDNYLYEDEKSSVERTRELKDLKLKVEDTLLNIGPVSSFDFAPSTLPSKPFGLTHPNNGEQAIVASGGEASTGKLSMILPSVQPTVKSSLKFNDLDRIWVLQDTSGESKFLVTTDWENYKTEIFKISDQYRSYRPSGFNNSVVTLGIAVIGRSIVHVTRTKISVYDLRIRLLDSTPDFEDEIVFCSIDRGYVLVTTQDGSCEVFSVKEKKSTKKVNKVVRGDDKKRRKLSKKVAFEEVEVVEITHKLSKHATPKVLADIILVNGHVSLSSMINFAPFATAKNFDKLVVFLVTTADNRVLAFSVNHKEKVYELCGADTFSEYVTVDLLNPNKSNPPDPFVKQVLLCTLGSAKDEYLCILTIGGEVILYRLFFDKDFKLCKENDACKIPVSGAPDNAYPQGTAIERRLVYLRGIGGSYVGDVVFVTGVTCFFITKQHNSVARMFKFTALSVLSVASFHSADIGCSSGLIFVDSHKNARIAQIPSLKEGYDYSNTRVVRSLTVGETIKCVAHHKGSNTYIVSTYTEMPYKCIDEDGSIITGTDTNYPPGKILRGSLLLVSPISWTVIDRIELQDTEVGMSVKSVTLDTSMTHFPGQAPQLKEFVLCGSGKYRIEDLSSNGCFRVYEIIDIIPEPGRPETNHKFKQVTFESTRGACTSVSEVFGRFLVAQGQKVIVRDLQEDNTVVPVAFVDTSIYVSETKSFQNMVILGDSTRGLVLVGFDAEPYRMIMLGKDVSRFGVDCAEFIVDEGELYILVADSKQILHLFKYDPEDPLSLQGQKLMRKSVFRLNATTNAMKLVKFKAHSFLALGSNVDGSFYSVRPVGEQTYRRLFVLQQQIFDKEPHIAGLNPRLNRTGQLEEFSEQNTAISRPMIDYDVVKRFSAVGIDRQKIIANKISKNSRGVIFRDFLETEDVGK